MPQVSHLLVCLQETDVDLAYKNRSGLTDQTIRKITGELVMMKSLDSKKIEIVLFLGSGLKYQREIMLSLLNIL